MFLISEHDQLIEVFDTFFVRLNGKRFVDVRNLMKHAKMPNIASCCLLTDHEDGLDCILAVDEKFKILYFKKKT